MFPLKPSILSRPFEHYPKQMEAPVSNRSTLRLSALSLATAAAVSLASLALAGCGSTINPYPMSTSAVSLPRVSGVVMGGSAPIVSATITAWETGSSYGAATSINTTTSDSVTGSFGFSTPITCTSSSDYVYLTSTGGSVTGSGSPLSNPNYILAAAVGSCAKFAANTTDSGNVFLTINEVSTVAAAYALGSFATVSGSGTGATQKLLIGAPANNNAGTGSCTAGTISGATATAMTCTAAGLGHAFQNAFNLTDSVTYAGSALVTATGTATVSGVVSSLSLTSGGTGYTSAPAVTVSGGGGTGAAVTAVLNGGLASVSVGSGGSGYSSTTPPAVTIAGDGTGAAATATVSAGGLVTGFTITNAGSGYSFPPLVTVAAPTSGTTATATATIGGSVSTLIITSGGTGYTSSPTIAIAAPSTSGGTTATATATTAQEVTGITVTTAGSGYETAPTVTISAPSSGTTATATATLTSGGSTAYGEVASFTVTNGGSGYTSAPTVTVSTPVVSKPGGLARTTVPGNANASVPQALIHTLANILGSCTNTSGGSGSSGNPNANPATTSGTDGTACGNLFAFTSATSVPTDEFTAMANLARNPNHNVGTSCVSPATGLYCIVPATSSFQPSLSGAPHDWTIPIVYTNVPNVRYVALDANDNVYALTTNSTSFSQSGIVTSGQAALTSNGTPIWTNALSSAFPYPIFMATDTLGNLWLTDYSTSGQGDSAIAAISTSTGATNFILSRFAGTNPVTPSLPTYEPYGIAIDQYNNVWYSQYLSNNADLVEIPLTANVSGGCSPATYCTAILQINAVSGFANPGNVQIDQNQNVWISALYGSGAGVSITVVPNTNAGTAGAAPAYTQVTTSNSSTKFFNLTEASTVDTLGWGLAFDGSGNTWAGFETTSGTVSTFDALVVPAASGVITGAPSLPSPSTTTNGTSGTKPYESMFDGNGDLFYDYYSGTGAIYYYQYASALAGTSTTGTAFKSVEPCYAANGATACASFTTSPISDPRSLKIDSTGSVWVGAQASSTGLVQFIGLAAPTWPQLSYGHFGVEPQ
jgi:hypothetical protein